MMPDCAIWCLALRASAMCPCAVKRWTIVQNGCNPLLHNIFGTNVPKSTHRSVSPAQP